MSEKKNVYLFDFSAVEHLEQYCCLARRCYVCLWELDTLLGVWIFRLILIFLRTVLKTTKSEKGNNKSGRRK